MVGYEEYSEARDFDSSPRLNHSKLASYEWGTGELLFSPEASLRKEVFVRSMLEIGQGHTSLESPEDLICLISLVHEYRHFQQDLLTGLGNWDYAARLRATISRFSICKNMSADGSVQGGRDDALVLQNLDSEDIVFSRTSSKEIEIIGDLLENEFQASREYASLFTTRRILEMDAVLYTSDLVNGLRMSLAAGEALKGMSSIYEFVHMPPVYGETISFCLSELFNSVIDDAPPLEKIRSLLFSLRVIINLALMHPSPDYLIAHGQDCGDYIPGIRFLRLLRATGDLMKDEGAALTSAEGFDAYLCQRSGFPYPTYRQSLESWRKHLASLAPDPFSEVTRARLSVVEGKLFNAGGDPEADAVLYQPIFNGESALSMIQYDLPLFATRTDGGEQAMLMTGRSIVGDEYAIDRKRATLAWRLSNLASGARKEFVCPLTSLAYCSVKKERCSAPYRSLEDLPDDRQCRASAMVRDNNRRSLKV